MVSNVDILEQLRAQYLDSGDEDSQLPLPFPPAGMMMNGEGWGLDQPPVPLCKAFIEGNCPRVSPPEGRKMLFSGRNQNHKVLIFILSQFFIITELPQKFKNNVFLPIF